MPLDVDGAFAAYEAARHRLPQSGRQGAALRVSSLLDVADQFDTFLLDAFGVLNIGETAIPGVPERIAAFQSQGKRVMVLTNAASYPLDALVAKYQRLGYEFAPGDVVSSRMALLAEITSQPGLRWGVMATQEFGADDLDGLNVVYLGDDPGPYRDVDGFLMLSSKGWTEDRQTLLESALRDRPRPLWVGNPDIVAPREDGFSTEPGYYAHRLADLTGVQPRFFGKPFANIYDLAFSRLDETPDRARVLMVGDSLHTDILGAQNAGVASALIAGYGFFAGHDVDTAIENAGIRPDFILDRP